MDSSVEAYYLQAQRVRRLVVEDFQRVFQSVDLLLTPTAPMKPPRLTNGTVLLDSQQTFINDIMTVPAALAGM